LLIREDLLNNYAKKKVNYCTAASNNSLHDSLLSSVNLLKKKEEQLLQLENKLDYLCSELSAYKDKNIRHDKRLGR
jgi:hypothetical protein